MKQYHTNYREAVNWLGNDFILCNEILYFGEMHELEFGDYDDHCDDETLTEKEIYQYYLTNCTIEQAEYLHEHFGLRFAYHEELELVVLLVDHLGTAWDYVDWYTDIKNAECELGKRVKPF